MRTIFHITTRKAWDQTQSEGSYRAESLAAEGFIHFSRPHQVIAVADSIFRGHRDLVLLQVNQDSVTSPVKYEGGENSQFPHVYGPINLDAVMEVFDFEETLRGFRLPDDFTMVGDVCLRLGRPGDEAEISSVHTHAWQQSYRGIVPDSILDSRPLSYRSRLLWWRDVVLRKSPVTVFVAESAQNGIVGFCSVEPARDEEFKGYGEIGAIYCLNEFKNRGVGAALFRMGVGHLRSLGYLKFYLWVLRNNPTIEFYERMGGRRTGCEKSIELGRSLTEIVYEWTSSTPIIMAGSECAQNVSK